MEKVIYRLINKGFTGAKYYIVINQENRNKKRVFIRNEKDFENFVKNGVELAK